MSALMLAIFIACGGNVAIQEPGRAMICHEMHENAVGGQSASCEWIRVTK